MLEQWRNLSPAEVINEIEISIANYLREIQKIDPRFISLNKKIIQMIQNTLTRWLRI